MFINFEKLYKFQDKFKLEDLFYLLAVKQQDNEAINEYKTSNEYKLLEEGYTKNLKNGELRLDKKGQKLLKDLGTSNAITEETEKLSEWLIQLYKGREDGIVKNKQQIKFKLQWFSDETGIYRNSLALLLQCFMNDCYTKESGLTIQEFKEKNPRMCMNNMLDNLFFKPESVFDKHYTLSKSPLYNYFEDNKEYVEQVWAKNGIEI